MFRNTCILFCLLFHSIREGDTSVSGTIWECYYDFDATTVTPKTDSDGNLNFESGEVEKGGWCVERLRTDKKMPNDERVVKSVFEVCLMSVSIFRQIILHFFLDHSILLSCFIIIFCFMPVYLRWC